jgi:hypothetical protein
MALLDGGAMRSPVARAVGGTLLVVAASAATAPAADLAVLRVRVPARVKIDDAHPKATARAAVRIANRGAAPVAIADAPALAAVARLSAAPLEGPIACAPVGVAPVGGLRFPLVLRPGRGRTLRWALHFTEARRSRTSRRRWAT